jgi:hypothetical protein
VIDAKKVLLVGDTHGQLRWWEQYVAPVAAEQGVDVVVQLGDFGLWPSPNPLNYVQAVGSVCPVPVYWLDGNHEWFDLMEQNGWLGADEPVELAPNISYLPRGYSWTWGESRYMAMGGAYSVDKPHRTEGHSWWPQEEITDADVERALQQESIDVLFCHDAPTGIMVPGVHAEWKQDEFARESAPNRDRLRKIVDALLPSAIYHGHYHVAYHARLHDVLAHSDSDVDADIIGLNMSGEARNCGVLDIDEGFLGWVANPRI